MSYSGDVISALLRLLAAMSLMLMPLGMAQGASLTQTASAQGAAHAMADTGHCLDGEESGKSGADTHHHCAACSAVPSIAAPLSSVGPTPKTSLTALPADLLSGLALEIATPPPKQG